MACLALDHRRQHCLNQPEHAVDVDREQFVPGIGIPLGDITGNVEPGIGQQDIDPSETVDGLADDAVDLGRFGQVGGKRKRTTNLVGHGTETLSRPSDQGQAGALGCQGPGQGATNT